MDVVIQCAATKVPTAGFFGTIDGRKVRFVARPELCAAGDEAVVARPDDFSDVANETWRTRLAKYVENNRDDNPYGLLKAYQLYRHPAYAALVESFGEKHVFVLSAGWGLIRSDYLTPTYDITFNTRAKLKSPEAFCDSSRMYRYFQQLPDADEPVLFIGGRDYLPLFNALTTNLRRERIAFFRTDGATSVPAKVDHNSRIRFRPYTVAARTNWHYQCALALAKGMSPTGARNR